MSETSPSEHSSPIEFTEEEVRAARAGRGKRVFQQALKRSAAAEAAKKRSTKPASTRRKTSTKG